MYSNVECACCSCRMHISNLLDSNVYCAAAMVLSLTVAAAAAAATSTVFFTGIVIGDLDDVMFMFSGECLADKVVIVVGKWISCADMRKMSNRKLTAIVTE